MIQDRVKVALKDKMKGELVSLMAEMGFQPPLIDDKLKISDKVDLDPINELNQSSKAKCPLDSDPFAEIPEGGLKCLLMLENNGTQRVVAIGRVFSLSDKLHGKPLPSDQMKVTIKIPLDKDSEVAVPTDEIQKAIQAVGSFIAWPKYWIDFNVQAYDKLMSNKVKSGTIKESNVQPKELEHMPVVNPSTLPKVCKMLYALAKRMNSSSIISIPIEDEIVKMTYVLYLSKANIYQFLAMSMLNTSCIEFYILYLYHLCHEKGISNRFGFVCPTITRCGADPTERTTYIEKCLIEEKKEYLLALCIDEKQKHWMLAAIYPYEDKVFWFDPLGHSPRPKFRGAVESAPKIYHVRGGIRKQGAKLTWIKVKCPRQKGGVECGYFVMTYMKELVNGIHDQNDPRKCFKGEKPYTQEEIDATRSE